jgi:isoquinoline 1-oxidoreductase
MSKHETITLAHVTDDEQLIEPVGYDFGFSRRAFVQALGAGLVIAATTTPAVGLQQQGRGVSGGRREPAPVELGARLHIGNDGAISVMTGKVEAGQGSRAQITQAAAEELRISPADVRVVMADTGLCPDDGITAGSRTTPATLPSVRQACSAARQMLDLLRTQRRDDQLTYAHLASADTTAKSFKRAVPRDVTVARVEEWKLLGQPLPRPNAREIVTGAHRFPSDVVRPGMLYAKVLRAPSYGATLRSIDVEPAQSMADVVVVRDGAFVAVAAPTTHLAKLALQAIEKTAQWERAPHADSRGLFDHLRSSVKEPIGPAAPSAGKVLEAKYDVAYVQHAPMEPRAAVAQWEDGKLTVWTATQNPFGVRRELANAFHLAEERVRVIVPDFGGGFGGKHTGETAVEAARVAQAARKPVAVRWTRAEEFTWAAFRPAAAIDVRATLDERGNLSSWHFVNINSGRSAVETPYRVSKSDCRYVESAPPLRHGSYRALAATANNFARESFMDELAHAAGRDPLEFRLAHLEDQPRVRAVLEDVAKRFDWHARRAAPRKDGTGIGLACGTEKGSFVAACAEVAVDQDKGVIHVKRIAQTFECGAITSPRDLLAQVEGCMIMALGPALREAVQFTGGRITNASFWKYEVPRLNDLPPLDIHLLNRPDLPSSGAGETPIIAVAPAVANAVFHATGIRLRAMPLRLEPAPGPAGAPVR